MVRKKAGILLHKNYKSLMALFSSHIVAGMPSNDLEHLDRNTYKARCPGWQEFYRQPAGKLFWKSGRKKSEVFQPAKA